jgi:hypothetical protein
MTDTSKDTEYTKTDQLPLVNLTLLFCDEYGYASYQRLLGVTFVMDGTVYSSSDMYTEKQLTYMASDLTPLMPLDLSNFYQPAFSDPARQADPTPAWFAKNHGEHASSTVVWEMACI